MTDPALEVQNLRKTFGGIVAVDGASFSVEEGSLTGLIGPNGAGKTTTFNLVSGFYEPDGGTVRYRGQDIQELMGPSRDERAIWTTSGAVTFGVVGLGLAATTGAAPAAAGAVAGAAAGVGTYHGQEHIRRAVLGGTRSRPFQLAREGLVRTFQITRELSEMTVLENMMLAPMGQRGESLLQTWFRRDAVADQEAAVRDRALEVIDLLELDHLTDELAGNLSGGQRKLLELGRVLMTEPDVILLDEPVAGVNPTLTRKLLERIRDLRDEGYTFLIVEHDMEVIMNLSDTIIVMSEGKKLTEGTPEEVRTDERVIDAYLGG
jgi:branched-chain amino acid transport system ATP-binding protein